MAGTVTTDLAFFTGATGGSSAADAITDWTGTGLVLDTVAFVQGTGSIYTYLAPSTTSRLADFACTSTSIENKVIYFWFALGKVGFLDTKAAGGLRLRVEDASANYGEWYVAGSDTLPHNGFICHAVHTSITFDAQSATAPDKAAITKICVRAYGSFPGKAYTWVDAVRAGTYLQIKAGTEASPATLGDLYTAEQTVANQWGVLSKIGGIYFVQGQLFIGSTTAAEDTYFKDTSQVVVFKNALIPSGFYEIKVQGNSTATTQKVFFGNKSGTAGIQGVSFRCESGSQTPKFKFTATDTYVTDLGVYGSGFVAADTISLPAYSTTREVLNTSFESCAEVLPNTCIVTNCNFISSSARAIRISSASHNVTSSNFISCQTAVHHDVGGATGSHLKYDYNALKFTGGTYHIENSAVTPNYYIDIDRLNGSNPDPEKIYNSNGGSTTLLEIGVPLEINGVKTGTEPSNYVRCRIEKQSDNSTIMNQEAQTSYGTEGFYKATMSYSYTADVPVRVRARYKSYLPFESTGTITSGGLTVTAVWQADPNYTP